MSNEKRPKFNLFRRPDPVDFGQYSMRGEPPDPDGDQPVFLWIDPPSIEEFMVGKNPQDLREITLKALGEILKEYLGLIAAPFHCPAHSCTMWNSDRTLICAIRHRRGDRHCGECDEGRKCLKMHNITESPHDLLFAKHNIPASPQTIPTIERYRNGS